MITLKPAFTIYSSIFANLFSSTNGALFTMWIFAIPSRNAKSEAIANPIPLVPPTINKFHLFDYLFL